MLSCQWWCRDPGALAYHDTEWGTPVHADCKHFEGLTLEVMQCGLSWELVLKKRQIFRDCFEGFDPENVAGFGEGDILRILETEGMIRSRRKVEATITNAAGFLGIQREFGSFDRYIWSFTGGKTLIYPSHRGKVIPENELSARISRDLKKRGFRYLGPVTVYSYLQACGLINDHDPDCPRYRELLDIGPWAFAQEE